MEIHRKRTIQPVMISLAKSLSQTFEIPFPAVTICPETKATRTRFDFSRLASVDMNNFTKDEMMSFEALYQVCDLSEYKFPENLTGIDNRTFNLVSTLNNLASPIDEMFSRCSYGSQKLTDCRKLFHKFIIDEGVCYTFNFLDEKDLMINSTMDESMRHPKHGQSANWFMEKDYETLKLKAYPQRVAGSGLHSGLSLELKVKKSDLNPGCKRGIQGFRISLHTPVEIPRMSKQFVSIPLNKQTTIAVKPHSTYSSKDIKSYSPEARVCFFTGESKLKFFKIYSKSGCELECVANQVLSACGCVRFLMPRDNETKVCDRLQLECAHQAEKNFSVLQLEKKLLSKKLMKDLKYGKISRDDKQFKKLEKMHSCNCLPSCTSLRYDSEISQTDFVVDDHEE